MGEENVDGCCFQLRPIDKLSDSNGSLGNNNKHFPSREKGTTTFPRKARSDLSFVNLSYTVKQWTFRHPIPVKKNILKGVSGLFPAGELTAIMGPSGAGKSTLLNALAGFVVRGVAGDILVNNEPRDPVKFRKQCCYIQQDDYLRKQLTVIEAMKYSSDLKLGSSVSGTEKMHQIEEILEMLGLQKCRETPTGGLSGGQKKRLSVALELVSNPPIIFLDEPTTGLDSSSCTQCISLLKLLAQQGRTVICTIHQPSSLVFEMFDNLYTLVDGQCLYSGSTKDIVPYLTKFDLPCPQYHNPADFLLDVAIGDYGADLPKLLAAAKEQVTKKMAFAKDSKQDKEIALLSGTNNNQYTEDVEPLSLTAKPANLLQQTYLLTRRKILMCYRSPTLFLWRIFAHILIGLVFGYLYLDCGVGAKSVLATYVYLYGSNLFCVYTGKMSATLLFPMELVIVTREHFNQWYKLGPYYMSMMLIEIPFQVLCCLLYLPLSYWLTGQPMIWDRLYLFCLSIILLSIVSQAIGFLIGICFNRKIAVFLGPILACLMSVFGFCLRYADTPVFFKWAYFVSYFRSAFHVTVQSIYGFNRENLYCPENEVMCVFQNPKTFLKEMDIRDTNIEANLIYTSACCFLVHVVTIFVVWFRLNHK